MTPVLELIDNPGGSCVADHVYGVVPPRTVTAWPGYVRLIVQSGNVSGLITGAALMFSWSVTLFVSPIESVTVIATGKPPVVVGVPEICPVNGSSVRFAGSPFAVQT